MSFPPDVLEIFHNLEAMSPLKAPGPDGSHSIFFQHHWDILSPNIVATIQEIFQTSEIPPNWGGTNLVLIPKIEHLEMISQFRPIRLCNTLYKLVTCIITQRLKPFLADAINPC